MWNIKLLSQKRNRFEDIFGILLRQKKSPIHYITPASYNQWMKAARINLKVPIQFYHRKMQGFYQRIFNKYSYLVQTIEEKSDRCKLSINPLGNQISILYQIVAIKNVGHMTMIFLSLIFASFSVILNVFVLDSIQHLFVILFFF